MEVPFSWMFCITEVGGKTEGNATLNCTVCGVLLCSGFTSGMSVNLLSTQWKMSSATQEKTKIWGHIALVLENDRYLE